MCGGGLSKLPEDKKFEGYITREENGFSFRLPKLNSCKTLSELGLFLLNAEMQIAKMQKCTPFIPKYICGNKHELRNAVLALNKRYGLPGVRTQQKVA